MAEEHPTTEAIAEVPSHGGEAHGSEGLIKVDGPMVALTWVTFGLMAFVLYRAAWKPILAALDKRENDIRKALGDAAKLREELASMEEKRSQIIAEADAKAKDLVEAARAAAVEAANTIEAKGREEAKILVENAQREIREAREKAIASLRKESADLAITLARKVIGEQLDEARSREITDRTIQRI
jgi:F-type H+-transporting ATPase subunit b